MTQGIFLILLILLPMSATAQTLEQRVGELTTADKWFYVGAGVVLGLDAFDTWSTIRCTTEFPKQCHEANPAIRPFVEKHGVKVALAGKLAVNAAILGGIAIVRHRKPEWRKLAAGAVLTMGGVQIVVDVSNFNTLQRLRRSKG